MAYDAVKDYEDLVATLEAGIASNERLCRVLTARRRKQLEANIQEDKAALARATTRLAQLKKARKNNI